MCVSDCGGCALVSRWEAQRSIKAFGEQNPSIHPEAGELCVFGEWHSYTQTSRLHYKETYTWFFYGHRSTAGKQSFKADKCPNLGNLMLARSLRERLDSHSSTCIVCLGE